MTSRQPARLSLGACAIVATFALVGCTAASPSTSVAGPSGSTVASASAEPSLAASQPASVEPSVASEPNSLLPFSCKPSVTIPATTVRAQITDVRVARHVIGGYDRVVFEFTSGIPDTLVEGVLAPLYADGSGLEMDVAGTAFLKVTMHGASRVSPEGGVTYAGPTNFEPGFDRLVQLIEAGDFEAVSTWYLGLDGARCYRVFTLPDPSRLVIDVGH
jgi:hypothetical protein